jgi:TPR repeat protein
MNPRRGFRAGRFQASLLRASLLALWAISGHAYAAVDLDQVASDPGKAWGDFLRDADIERAYSAYSVLGKVGYGMAGVDAALCEAHAGELARAVSNAPMSLAVLRGAMLCAEETGDTEQAGRLENALLALAKHALSGGSQVLWPRPIRVLGPLDAYALLHVAGLQYRYEYFDQLKPDRYFPLVVAAWDAESGKERQYVFDYVDSAASLKSADEYAGYPIHRHRLVDSFLSAQADNRELAAYDLKALMAAREVDGAPAKIKALRVAAGYGGIQSLRGWLTLCATEAHPGCADGLADTLVDLAEKKQVVPMVLLAFAQAEGIGVRRDPALAEQLLEAAMRLWSPEGVALEYQQMSRQAKRPRALERKALQEVMQSPALLASNAIRRMLDDDDAVLSSQEQQALAAPGANAVGMGQSWLAEYWRRRDDGEARQRALRLAADAGDADAQVSRAFDLLTDDGAVAERGQAQALMREAALGGRVDAMEYLAQQQVFRREWKKAANWLLAGVRKNDIDAMLELAALYERDHKDQGQTIQQAYEWYALLADNSDSDFARRKAAYLALRGRGTAKDPARALKWLLKDAEAGNVESQLQLGTNYLEGRFGEGQRGKGAPWIERVLASDDIDAKTDYAHWLFYRSNEHDGEARGMQLMGELQATGKGWSTNNLAWALCTAPNPRMRDTKRGAELAAKMLEDPDISSSWLDTVAACQAAAGDYPRAVQTQQRAIAGYTGYWDLQPGTYTDENGYLDRLKLYQEGKPYLDDESGDE